MSNPIYEEAGRVLDECRKGEITKVIKVARSGATTGIIANSIDRGEMFFIVAPTLRIAHEISQNAVKYSQADEQKTEVMNIHSNRECEMVKRQLKKHPNLAHLAYIPKDSCKGCDQYADCPVTRFIRVDDESVVGFGMTYAKFMVMIEAQRDEEGEVQNCLLNCLTNNFFDVDTILFDEAHQIEEDTLVDSIEINETTKEKLFFLAMAIEEREIMVRDEAIEQCCEYEIDDMVKTMAGKEGVKQKLADQSDELDRKIDAKKNILIKDRKIAIGIKEALDFMANIIIDNEEMNKDMIDEGEQNNQRLNKEIIKNPYEIELYKYFKAYLGFINDIKENNLYNKEDIILMSSVLNIIKNPQIHVQFIKDEEGSHIFYGTRSKLQLDIQDMLNTCNQRDSERRIIFTSATFSDPVVYEETFGDYNIVRMEDVMETNQSMTIIADNRPLEARNMFAKAKKYHWMIKGVEDILTKHPGLPVITVKKKVAEMLYMRLEADGFKTTVDYYRSTEMIGVDNPLREAIFVGMPVAPINTFDVISESYLESQSRRINQNHAAFYQAINRFKDPQGKKQSIIHCVGIKVHTLIDATTWAEAREVNFEVKDKRYLYKDIKTIDSTSDIGFGDYPEYLRMEPFKLMNITKKVSPDNESRLYSNIPISIYYWVLPIINVNRYGETVFAMNSIDYRNLFVSDTTGVYAEQTAKGSYYANHGYINDGMIKLHSRGAKTIGIYPKSWDGTTKVSCIDIDTHGDEDPAVAEEKLVNVMESLNSHGAKYLLEESNPNSYHILMFYDEGTPTENVYYLMKDVIQYAGYKVKGAGRIEIFPNSSRPYNPEAANKNIGLQFRMPLGKHQSKGTWGKYIDPVTREDIVPESCSIMDISGIEFRNVELAEEDYKKLEIAPVSFEIAHGTVDVDLMDALQLLNNDGMLIKGKNIGKFWRGDCPICERSGEINPSFMISDRGAKCFSCNAFAHDALALISKVKNITRYQAREWIAERIK